jgi:hypothetical protein
MRSNNAMVLPGRVDPEPAGTWSWDACRFHETRDSTSTTVGATIHHTQG